MQQVQLNKKSSVESPFNSKNCVYPKETNFVVFRDFNLPTFWLYDTEKNEWMKHT